MEAPLPIERFIANFCAEVPLPPPGRVQVRFGFVSNTIGENDSFGWRVFRVTRHGDFLFLILCIFLFHGRLQTKSGQ